MTKEPPIVIEDREELIFMLSEAAALEHMIMCQYLFAAFSLKRDVSEGVTAAQLADLQAIGANFRRLAAVLEPHVKTSQAGKT